MTVGRMRGVLATAPEPQWSPLLRSGMTDRHRRARCGARDAAMEPAPQERDDRRRAGECAATDRAAMEPAPQERDDAGCRSRTCRTGLPAPQWSPLLRSGMTSTVRRAFAATGRAAMEPAPQERDDRAAGLLHAARGTTGRNGARSSGAG